MSLSYRSIIQWAKIAVYAVVFVYSSATLASNQSSDIKLSGKELAERYCSHCHLVPDPADLSKEFWPMALRYMSHYVGMQNIEFPEVELGPIPPEMEPEEDYTYRFMAFDKIDNKDYIQFFWVFRNYMVNVPMMNEAEWLKIKDYYVDNARPRSEMVIEHNDPIVQGFKPVFPKLDLEPNGLVMATKVDEKRQRLYVGRSVLDDWYDVEEGYELSDDLLVFDLKTGKRIGQLTHNLMLSGGYAITARY